MECMLIIVCDDKRTFLALKDNSSSSHGIFGSLCDGMWTLHSRVEPGSTGTQWCIVVSESSRCVV